MLSESSTTSEALSVQERNLLESVSLAFNPRDGEYVPGRASHYLAVGLSAVLCVEDVFALSGARQGLDSCRSVLDLACGYGRVMRFLRARLPRAHLTACDIVVPGIEFCAHAFGATPVVSRPDFERLELPGPFDLIWCGSLLTHLTPERSTAALQLMSRHLAPGGMCVFTTMGGRAVEWLQTGACLYGLDDDSRRRALDGVRDTGYGYADEGPGAGWGISMTTPEWVGAAAGAIDGWRQVALIEHGWDAHHDVHGWSSTTAAR